jgi:monooxygenase
VALLEVPNLFYAIGYTDASWALRTDLISQYVCRLLTFIARDFENAALRIRIPL